MVANNALNPIDFGKGMADMGLSQQLLGVHMLQNGATPEELTAALLKNSQGQIPDGQNAAKGLMIVWAEFFGVLGWRWCRRQVKSGAGKRSSGDNGRRA
ncbi:TPA: hypothetical protein L7T56_005344 [Klebsiella pneumoniae]|nr:hypothetical protein [Klebsiella pneumoniae]